MATEKAKAAKYSPSDLKNLRILLENSAGGLGSNRESAGGVTQEDN